jgi:hypothetical protein
VFIKLLILDCKADVCKSTYNFVVNEVNVSTLPILYSFSFCGGLIKNSLPDDEVYIYPLLLSSLSRICIPTKPA